MTVDSAQIKRKVTMRDVAKAANVSQSTVSRILSPAVTPSKVPISEETKEILRQFEKANPENPRRVMGYPCECSACRERDGETDRSLQQRDSVGKIEVVVAARGRNGHPAAAALPGNSAEIGL